MHTHLSYGSRRELRNDFLQEARDVANKYGSVSETVWGTRAGAIDLVSILEISIVYAVMKAGEGLVEGFVGKPLFQDIGEKARVALLEKFVDLKNYLGDFYRQAIKGNTKRYGAIVLIEAVQGITIYVVLNHEHASESLIASIPESLAKVADYISCNGLPEDNPRTVQLFPNFKSQSWDYLFVPSVNAFGQFVDRYLDLRNHNYYHLQSAEEFLAKFPIGDFDDFKLVVSPNRNFDHRKFDEL